MDRNLENIILCMPKVELHAHLNGSIGDKLLNHLKRFGEIGSKVNPAKFPSIDSEGVLLNNPGKPVWSKCVDSDKKRSLKQCWDSFSKIHEVIRTPRILYVATVNVIAEFSSDNVVYLELRTGPKKVHDILSKNSYVEAVIQGIKDCQKKFPIIVKLLLSVNRKDGKEEAYEVVELAKKMADLYPEIVVGLDVSGDPNHGHWSWIVEVMGEARKKGLKISCHLPEIVNPEEGLEFMKFGPERVGHGQYLHPSYGGTEELWKLAKLKHIPIETCISSNLVSGVAASVDDHVFKFFHEESMPFVICTDDSGVFNTSLSLEFMKFASVVRTTPQELLRLCLDAATYSFATDEEKSSLQKVILEWWKLQQDEKLNQ